MRKLLYLVFTAAIMMTACNNKPKTSTNKTKGLPIDSLVVPYDDEYFSALLPQGWTWATDTCETWQIKHIVDSLRITSGVTEFYPPDNSFKIRLVKGATRWLAPNNPVSDCVSMILMRADADSTCIYISEVRDSLQVDEHEACNVWTAYDLGGDTIIQDQYVVIKDKYDLYYLSGVFDYGDDKSSRLWNKILSTIKLK